MKSSRLLELVVTRFFLLSVIGISTVLLGVLFTALALGYASLDQLAQGVDLIVKVLALLVGTWWALNRYYISRSDVPQIKVEAILDLVEGHEFSPPSDMDLLLYRLDILNTGKALIPSFRQAITFEAVWPAGTEAAYKELHRWPEHGMHLAGAVEPGSWSAINSVLPVPRSVVAVRIFVDLLLEEDTRWTWHRTFRIHRKDSVKSEEESAPNPYEAPGRQGVDVP